MSKESDVTVSATITTAKGTIVIAADGTQSLSFGQCPTAHCGPALTN